MFLFACAVVAYHSFECLSVRFICEGLTNFGGGREEELCLYYLEHKAAPVSTR